MNSVAWLANILGSLGIPFLAGEIILSGSLSVMAWIKEPSTFTCEFGSMGSCTVSFT